MTRCYRKIPIWENRRRVELLTKFRSLIVEYFNNVSFEYSIPIENRVAKDARRNINLILNEVNSVIISAGIKTVAYYSGGGSGGSIDLIQNVFNLHYYLIGYEQVLDMVDRAIGVYESDKSNALLRTLNPLFWISLILDYIVSLPFKFVGKMGFNQSRIESSIVGRIVKGIFYLVTVLASFLTALDLLGYREKFLSLIKSWIKW